MLKMQKKNHEHVLEDKAHLIQNLQDIVAEKELQLQGDGASARKGTAGLQKLVDQIAALHKDKGSLMESTLEAKQELEVGL